jgi:hypothetical protein
MSHSCRSKENAGCPWPDTDGDSVLDKDDECPEVVGTVANKGCPEVTQADLDAISLEARSVFFLCKANVSNS